MADIDTTCQTEESPSAGGTKKPTKKERQAQKQREHCEKLKEEIVSGTIQYEKHDSMDKRHAQSNRKCGAGSVEEEIKNRQETIEGLAMLYKRTLRPLLEKLSKIPDPRNTAKTKHTMATLLIYGIVLFIFKVGSRRTANVSLSTPTIMENIRAVIPEFESMPHADSLARLLERVDAGNIESSYISFLRDLIRGKKFRRLLIEGRYAVAIDGSQKFYRNHKWHDNALERHVGKDGEEQYYVYVLEATIIFGNGMVLPLYTETLSNEDWKPDESKQDCELKAFKRLAPKLRELLGSNVAILADGLYACEPVMKICRQYNWAYIFTLKNGNMPTAWTEFNCHMEAGLGGETNADCGDVRQHYRYVNGIGEDILNERAPKYSVVTCTEIDCKDIAGKDVQDIKPTEHAWVSSYTFTPKNVVRLCNMLARKRWAAIESTFHIEKHDGYGFEHCYSLNWNAMVGFHCLMKIAHCMNELMVHSEIFAEQVAAASVKGFIDGIFLAIRGCLLDIGKIIAASQKKFLWRITLDNVFVT